MKISSCLGGLIGFHYFHQITSLKLKQKSSQMEIDSFYPSNSSLLQRRWTLKHKTPLWWFLNLGRNFIHLYKWICPWKDLKNIVILFLIPLRDRCLFRLTTKMKIPDLEIFISQMQLVQNIPYRWKTMFVI